MPVIFWKVLLKMLTIYWDDPHTLIHLLKKCEKLLQIYMYSNFLVEKNMRNFGQLLITNCAYQAGKANPQGEGPSELYSCHFF